MTVLWHQALHRHPHFILIPTLWGFQRRGGRRAPVHFGWKYFWIWSQAIPIFISQLFCFLTSEDRENKHSVQPTFKDCFEDLGDDSRESVETNKVLNVCIYTDVRFFWDVLKSRQCYGQGIAKVPFSREVRSSGASPPGLRCQPGPRCWWPWAHCSLSLVFSFLK